MNLKLNIKKPPTVVFCLPAPNFSGKWFDAFLFLLDYCNRSGINYMISRRYSPVIYYVRNMCLGGDVLRGPKQKPFNGKVDYTHIMWIDSDIIFTPEHFQRLLDHDKDIVSGIYMMSNGYQFATVKDWDENYFVKHGHFHFMTENDIKNKGLIEVDYTGLGFMLVKRGVFESLNYPWFQPKFYNIGPCTDFSSEDVSFCKMIKERGYDIYVDTNIRVKHEKLVLL